MTSTRAVLRVIDALALALVLAAGRATPVMAQSQAEGIPQARTREAVQARSQGPPPAQPQIAEQPDHAVVPPPTDPVVREVNAELEALTRRVAGELRCPVCQGLSIGDSPSDLAVGMKDVIRDQLAAGRTPDEVKAYFVERYGTWVLLEPEPRGFNLLVYLLPLVAVLGGGTLIALAVRRWTARPPTAGTAAAQPESAADSWDDVALEASARPSD